MIRHALMAAAATCAVGCSTDIDLTNRPLWDNGVNVFEAQVVDGATGALIPGATVQVSVGRHALVDDDPTDAPDVHTIYGIPYGTFRVSAAAEGYADFQAMKDFDDGSPFASLANGDPLVYYFNNIVMYTEGSVPAAITVSVYDGTNGDPVANATVVASLTGITTGVPISDALPPEIGLRPVTLAGETDAEGKATFAADTLVMNGTYSIDVFGALDANGITLVPDFNSTVTVGQDVQEVLVFLSNPYLYPVALSANNEDPTSTQPNLVVTFPYAVELCNTQAAWDWFNSTSVVDQPNANGVTTQPTATMSVTAALSSGNSVLTVDYETATEDLQDDLQVYFTNVQVKPAGASDASCEDLSNVGLRDPNGFANVNPEITVRDL